MSKKEYDISYATENLKRISFNLNRNTDQDIISYLESKSNVQGFLKSLIRERIKEEAE